jgi:hypothetical protein
MSRGSNAAFPALHHPVNSAAEFYYEDRVVGTAAEGPGRFWPTAGLAAGDPAAAYLDVTPGGGWPVAAGAALDHRPMASHDVERYLNGGSNGGDVISGGGVYSPCLGSADRPLSRASLRSSSSADSAVDDTNGVGVGLGHQQHLPHHQHQHHHQGFLTGGGGRQFPVIAVMAADSQQQEEGGHTGFTPEHCYTGFID